MQSAIEYIKTLEGMVCKKKASKPSTRNSSGQAAKQRGINSGNPILEEDDIQLLEQLESKRLSYSKEMLKNRGRADDQEEFVSDVGLIEMMDYTYSNLPPPPSSYSQQYQQQQQHTTYRSSNIYCPTPIGSPDHSYYPHHGGSGSSSSSSSSSDSSWNQDRLESSSPTRASCYLPNDTNNSYMTTHSLQTTYDPNSYDGSYQTILESCNDPTTSSLNHDENPTYFHFI